MAEEILKLQISVIVLAAWACVVLPVLSAIEFRQLQREIEKLRGFHD